MYLYLGTMKFKTGTAYNSDTHTHRGGFGRAAAVEKKRHFLCFEVLTLGGMFAVMLLQCTLKFPCPV
jgi:hypothetical protein